MIHNIAINTNESNIINKIRYQYNTQNTFRLMDIEGLVTGLTHDTIVKNCTGKKLNDKKLNEKIYGKNQVEAQ